MLQLMPSYFYGFFGILLIWQEKTLVTIKPERLLESRAERYEVGGTGLTWLASHHSHNNH